MPRLATKRKIHFGHIPGVKRGYSLFSANARIGLIKEWKSKNPEKTLNIMKEFSSQLGSMWKTVSEDEKTAWKQKAARANDGLILFFKDSDQVRSMWETDSNEEKPKRKYAKNTFRVYNFFAKNARIKLREDWKLKNPESTTSPNIIQFNARIALMWKSISKEDKIEWKQRMESNKTNVTVESHVFTRFADGDQTPTNGLSSDDTFVSGEQTLTEDHVMPVDDPVSSVDEMQTRDNDLFSGITSDYSAHVICSLEKIDFPLVDLNEPPEFTVLIPPTLLDEMSEFFLQKK
jgi:hypothetical protein